MPLLTALPLLPCAVIVGLFLWFLYAAAAIYDDRHDFNDFCVASTGMNTTSIAEVKDNAMKDYIFIFHFFMFMDESICSRMTLMIIRAVSAWYFRPREVDDPDRKLTGNPFDCRKTYVETISSVFTYILTSSLLQTVILQGRYAFTLVLLQSAHF